jgi:predicted amidohydrolase YtcJ
MPDGCTSSRHGPFIVSEEWHKANRHMLDAVAPDNPVILTDMFLYNAVVNSRALALAGITKDTS